VGDAAFGILHPAPRFRHPASGIRHSEFRIRHPASPMPNSEQKKRRAEARLQRLGLRRFCYQNRIVMPMV
jgi:hypothetical protein